MINKEQIAEAAEKYAEQENSAWTNDYNGFIAGAMFVQQLLQQTAVSGALPPSGIEEFDKLIKQFQNLEIDFLALTCGLWNKGYNAGKEYCSVGNDR